MSAPSEFDPSLCVAELSRSNRLDRWCPLPLRFLKPEQRVRDLCAANLCGSWGRHPQCPPRVGTLAKARSFFAGADSGLLLQRSFQLDPRDKEEERDSRRAFAEALLALEGTLLAAGAPNPYALFAGPCALCGPCPALDGSPCLRPELARPSVEALGVDVMAMLDAVGWDGAFLPDRLTWTGAILFLADPPGR
ncbi:MAG: DUF2284 domain-containing protein [Polyangia bacterium]|nr:DUF2284 domain-containing protein [Polyangia bacterium]